MSPPIDRINTLSRDEFVAEFGGTFEHSPWVAERAWEKRPFADPAALHAAMREVVATASEADKITLLRAHPDLAGKEAQEGTMTDHSVSEQSSAGLDALRRDEIERIAALNAAYRAKHGFPFIIAVRRYNKEGIFAEFERRLANDSRAELDECLKQIFDITWLRLQARA